MIFLRISAAFVVATLLILALSFCLSNYYLDEHYEAVADDDIAGAERNADRAARLDPFSTEVLVSEANVVQNEGRYQKAESLLREAAEREPADYQIREELGDLKLNAMNRPSEAAASYRRALELNPEDSSVRAGLADAYVSTGQLDKAKPHYERLRQENQLAVGQVYDFGRIQVRTGEPGKGVATLRQARNRAKSGLNQLPEGQRQSQRAFLQSVNLALADALVAQRRYAAARRIVANSPAEQAPTILSLIDSNPEGYRRTVINSDVY